MSGHSLSLQEAEGIIRGIARRRQKPGHPILNEEDLVGEGWLVWMKVRSCPAALSTAMNNRITNLYKAHCLYRKRGALVVSLDDPSGPFAPCLEQGECGNGAAPHWVVVPDVLWDGTDPEGRLMVREEVSFFVEDLDRLEQEILANAVEVKTTDADTIMSRTGRSRPQIVKGTRGLRGKVQGLIERLT